jgi:hypothetical protein
MNLRKLLSFESGRLAFFDTLTKNPDNWQKNTTPFSLVRKMVEKTTIENKKILVLFNIEFLQVLIEEKNVNRKDVVFIADNELEYLTGLNIFKVRSFHLKEHSPSALKKLIQEIPEE